MSGFRGGIDQPPSSQIKTLKTNICDDPWVRTHSCPDGPRSHQHFESSCADYEALNQLGRLYNDNFIRCCRLSLLRVVRLCSECIISVKANKGRTPVASRHPSRPTFDNHKEWLQPLLMEAPQDHQSAKNKVGPHHDLGISLQIQLLVQALVRDGFRCVISGKYEATSYDQSEGLPQKVAAEDQLATPTRCAHIFPDFTNAQILGSNEGGAKMWYLTCFDLDSHYLGWHKYSAPLCLVLAEFGYTLIFNKLNQYSS